MTKLTVTARGRVILPREVLGHLGVEPGGKIELDLLPDGRAALKTACPVETTDRFLGLLAGKTNKVANL